MILPFSENILKLERTNITWYKLITHHGDKQAQRERGTGGLVHAQVVQVHGHERCQHGITRPHEAQHAHHVLEACNKVTSAKVTSSQGY